MPPGAAPGCAPSAILPAPLNSAEAALARATDDASRLSPLVSYFMSGVTVVAAAASCQPDSIETVVPGVALTFRQSNG